MTTDNEINQQENDAIDELRQRLKGDLDPDIYNDKYYLLRFLRARDLNIGNAEVLLRKSVEFREKHDIKNILQYKKPEVMEKYLTNVMLGYDKEGCVIRYCPGGSLDFVGMMASLPPEDVTKVIFYEAEADTVELKKQSEKLGKNVDQCVYIYDFKNLSFATVTDKTVLLNMLYTVSVFINNYPERLKAGYLLNVSLYFNLLFAVMRPVLPKAIIEKIHMYHDDSYKENLLKIIDADVLPAFLGGNRTDPDGNPDCLTIIKPAERVPKSYYLQKGKRSLSKSPGVKKISLSRAAFHEENLEVEEAGSYLEWEFETKCRDIGFGLFYNETVNGEEQITELVPIQRINTEVYPETGTYRCQHTGKYVIVFDNTYSWVRQKEIYFRTKIVTPQEHESQLPE